MTQIRYMQKEDREFWYSLDRHLPQKEFDRKVRDQNGYVLTVNGQPAGLLRYQFFWDQLPFCTLIYVHPDYQRKGLGKRLMRHWEQEMKDQGHPLVLTSTQVDESAQHFYRKLGYKECGALILEFSKYAQPMEMFLIKPL